MNAITLVVLIFSLFGAADFFNWLTPFLNGFYEILNLDPLIIPASLFANDMGGMTLAQTVTKSKANGFIFPKHLNSSAYGFH